MSALRLIFASLLYHWRTNVSVALAVAAATAVITGALILGDSVRGSLQALVVERLGSVDHVLVADHFFRQRLAGELASSDGFHRYFTGAWPAILLRGSVEFRDESAPGQPRRAAGANVFACGPWFWQLDASRAGRPPAFERGGVVLNQPLADELAVGVGDEVLLRLPPVGAVPAEAALGRKTTRAVSRRLAVSAIVPATGLGRFALRSHQQAPRNAYLPIATVQGMLGQAEKANAILVAGDSVPPAATEVLERNFTPQLADYGLALRRVTRTFAGAPVLDYFQLTSDRMILPPAARRAALAAWRQFDPQEAITYLANELRVGDAMIPYSTVTGIDSTGPLGPLDQDIDGNPVGQLGPDEIVVNQWVADDCRAQGVELKPGVTIRMTYFDPESASGEAREEEACWRLRAIVPLATPGGRPCATNDPNLTPEVAGVTDRASIESWDPPFPFDAERVRTTPPNDQDEQYWRAYRATPKAFVSLAAARRRWQSRFGVATSIRVPAAAGRSAAGLEKLLLAKLPPAALGMVFQPVKRRGLEAAGGTTPFEILFLLFSMFLIAAAIMLVSLLFLLGIQRRGPEVGILLAVGLSRARTRNLLLGEGLLVAGLGGLVGTAAAAGYAAAMLAALQSPRFWYQVVHAHFLRLTLEPQSVVVGLVGTVAVSALVISLALRRLQFQAVRRLLEGQGQVAGGGATRPARRPVVRAVAWGCLVAAAVSGVVASRLGGEAQAGAFFAAGSLTLAAVLALVRLGLEGAAAGGDRIHRRWGLGRLAARNVARDPGRSTLTIGLIAAASFLIVAVSAFRLDPTPAGTGGFALYAESQMAVLHDLNSARGRAEFGFAPAQLAVLDGTRVFPLRVHGGDDASCLNLYQSQQPRLLGVPRALADRGGFAWAASAAATAAERASPWLLLRKPITGQDGALPVVLDKNTAMYSLHLWGGVGSRFTIHDPGGEPLLLQVVGLLQNSIFQGDLLLDEATFLRHFPAGSGYRVFLIDAPDERVAAVSDALEDRLGDLGFDAVPTAERLRDFLDVQNTYLSTFQSLGGLGLLLGTFGLAAVQLRSVFERRGELALMRACGFSSARLLQMMLAENTLLLVGGLALGVLAAVAAVMPQWLFGTATVPWWSLGAMLAAVLAVGLGAGLLAARVVVRGPVLPALRGR